MIQRPRSSTRQLVVAAAAAFGTYFCMYAFRKPFTAGTFEGQEVFGLGLKAVLVVSQLAGYMLSKFVGIKLISETRPEYRASSIVGLILISELALLGFAFAPVPLKVVMMFVNGLPLGMVFGLVLAYLEGRTQTEALSAALCASFIVSSGVVKSVGQWLIQEVGVTEYQMPAVAGLIFVLPLLASVCVLRATPPPDDEDRHCRRERNAMDSAGRKQFLAVYWPALLPLVFVYAALTVIRTIRDDFGVELWRELGVNGTPSIFARTETVVAICVTALNGSAIWIRHNPTAIRLTVVLMCGAFALVGASAALTLSGHLTSFAFMVACGVGLYVPYVAFHTTVFERLIAVSRSPCNLGFLMYLADAVGYLGYAVVVTLKSSADKTVTVLPFFLSTLLMVASTSICALLLAIYCLEKRLACDQKADAGTARHPPLEELVPAE
jgi:hypothetical protein